MKDISFDSIVECKSYGLSCVENYLLYILKKEHIAFQYLFFQSNISFSAIIDAFIYEDIKFAYFNKIKRLQSIANEYGIIETKCCDTFDEELIKNHDYVLVMVKEEHILSKYKTKLLRPDHYILIAPLNDKEYRYLNDTPCDMGVIKKTNLQEVFGGKIIGINIKSDLSKELKLRFVRNFLQCFPQKNHNNCDAVKMDVICDIISVLKTVRNRLIAFSSEFTGIQYGCEYIATLSNLYFKCGYIQTRGIPLAQSDVFDILCEIEKRDNKILFETKMEVEKRMKEKIISIISNYTFVDKERISVTDELKNLGIDSFKMVELILELEKEFGVIFGERVLDMETLKDVQSIIDLVTDE